MLTTPRSRPVATMRLMFTMPSPVGARFTITARFAPSSPAPVMSSSAGFCPVVKVTEACNALLDTTSTLSPSTSVNVRIVAGTIRASSGSIVMVAEGMLGMREKARAFMLETCAFSAAVGKKLSFPHGDGRRSPLPLRACDIILVRCPSATHLHVKRPGHCCPGRL
jgi:hypothetical protein